MVRVCLAIGFFLNFLFLKTIFYFPNQKTSLVTQNRHKTKTISKSQFSKETENKLIGIFNLENTRMVHLNEVQDSSPS